MSTPAIAQRDVDPATSDACMFPSTQAGGPHPMGLAPDCQEPELAALGRGRQTLELHERRVRLGLRPDHARELVGFQVSLPEKGTSPRGVRP